MNSLLSDRFFLFLLGSAYCFFVFENPARDSLSASEIGKNASVQFSPQNPMPQSASGNGNSKDETQSGPDASNVMVLKGPRFTTTDGVKLEGSYYPGRNDKNTVPVLLLHGQRKSSQAFDPLIVELRKRGFAIVTFDFRGHGKSIKRIPAIEVRERLDDPDEDEPPTRRRVLRLSSQPREPQFETHIEAGEPVDYKESEFKPVDYQRLFEYDCLPVQKMLVALNNEGKLNLHKLSIVGFDMGGSVGAKWATQRPKYVKSLIVIEPNHDQIASRFFKNSRIFQKEVPVLFIVGELNAEAKLNAERLRDDLLGKEKEKNGDSPALNSIAPILNIPTDRRGPDLFSDAKLAVPQKIVEFIELKLQSAKEKDTRWKRI